MSRTPGSPASRNVTPPISRVVAGDAHTRLSSTSNPCAGMSWPACASAATDSYRQNSSRQITRQLPDVSFEISTARRLVDGRPDQESGQLNANPEKGRANRGIGRPGVGPGATVSEGPIRTVLCICGEAGSTSALCCTEGRSMDCQNPATQEDLLCDPCRNDTSTHCHALSGMALR